MAVQQLDDVRVGIIAHGLHNSSDELEASGAGRRSARLRALSKNARIAVRKAELFLRDDGRAVTVSCSSSSSSVKVEMSRISWASLFRQEG